jgi:hypothetical protein
MSIWDKISFNNFDGEEPKNNHKLDSLLKRSHNQLVGNHFRSINNKGKKTSEATKAKLAAVHKGKKLSVEHRESLKATKLIHKISKEEILSLQEIHVQAKDVAAALGITWHTYKRIATELGVYKKYDLFDRNKSQGNPVLAYKYDASQPNGKGEFVGEYYSINEAQRQLGLTTGVSDVLKGNHKQAKGYYFEYKPIV